jgi:hypothetical protein
VTVQVAEKGDEDDDGGCTSDDEWLPRLPGLPEQIPAAAAGSQQVVRFMYKVRVLSCDAHVSLFNTCTTTEKVYAMSKNANTLRICRLCNL